MPPRDFHLRLEIDTRMGTVAMYVVPGQWFVIADADRLVAAWRRSRQNSHIERDITQDYKFHHADSALRQSMDNPRTAGTIRPGLDPTLQQCGRQRRNHTDRLADLGRCARNSDNTDRQQMLVRRLYPGVHCARKASQSAC